MARGPEFAQDWSWIFRCQADFPGTSWDHWNRWLLQSQEQEDTMPLIKTQVVLTTIWTSQASLHCSWSLVYFARRYHLPGETLRLLRAESWHTPVLSSLKDYVSAKHVVAATAAKLLQLCLTLCNPIDGSPPGFPVPGILQERTLEWVAISFSNAWKWKVKSLSRVRLLVTPWTAVHQAPPSMGFSRQEYWSGVPLPSGVECHCLLQICGRYLINSLLI